MLTFVEAISLAGDRAKQNDDAHGCADTRAWVLDGATDLHDAPLTTYASDASWIAQYANSQLHGLEGMDLRLGLFEIATAASLAFANLAGGRSVEKWRSPISSLLLLEETSSGVSGLDLGDCRVFALDANSAIHIAGGPENAADDETALAARQADKEKPLLRRTETIDMLRRLRGELNRPSSRWTFCLDPACADQARAWVLPLARPAHVLLMSDGFSALVDRYKAYDAAGLVRAAVDQGLQELGRELRAIEHADPQGDRHPRFKKSDDSTALLMRLT